MLAYFLRRSKNSLYYLPNNTRIISQKTTFMSPYRYIFLHVSLVLSTCNKPKYFLSLFVSRLYFFVAIQRRWSNKLSLVVFNNDVAKMHLRKQRGDFAKFFPFFHVRCNIVCPTKLETRSQKETDGHFSSLCLLAACGRPFDYPWRGDSGNVENTISFSSSRLVHFFVCNRASNWCSG